MTSAVVHACSTVNYTKAKSELGSGGKGREGGAVVVMRALYTLGREEKVITGRGKGPVVHTRGLAGMWRKRRWWFWGMIGNIVCLRLRYGPGLKICGLVAASTLHRAHPRRPATGAFGHAYLAY